MDLSDMTLFKMARQKMSWLGQRQTVLAQNIANSNTAGFKRDHVAFKSLLYRTYRDPGALTGHNYATPTGLQIGSGVEIGSSIKQHQE